MNTDEHGWDDGVWEYCSDGLRKKDYRQYSTLPPLLRALLMLACLCLCLLSTAAHAQGTRNPGKETNVVAAKNRTQEVRAACIQGRRLICGRVLEVTTNGLVIDSGYTSLLQPPFNHSWLVPGNVSASRPGNLLEGTAPDSTCVGLIFLTDIPKRPKVRQYDYVVIHGYPAGSYNYKPVAGISKTVRRFSAGLEHAVLLNLQNP